MNTPKLLVALGLLPAALFAAEQPDPNCCGGSAPVRRVFREAVTHGQLVKHHENQADPIASLPVVQAPDPEELAKPPTPESLVSRSEVLQANGMVTLVPKRAVLHVPENLRGVLSRPPEGARLLIWRDFYTANRAWIETVEVNRAQAEGWKPLPEEFVESLSDRSRIVVAVMKGGPISVMPAAEVVAGPETVEKETE